MRNLFIFFLVLVFNILPLNGQSIKINNSYSPEVLVQDVFVNGACKNISKIRSIGNRAGIGFFEGGRPSIGLEKGIILSTGNIKNAEGPNQKRDITTDFGDVSSDVDLVKLATGPVFDVVGIEFDFVPLDSFVNFRYVFASDEYCEYVGQKFNDVFGFFVSGPGINGSFNNKGENSVFEKWMSWPDMNPVKQNINTIRIKFFFMISVYFTRVIVPFLFTTVPSN